MLTLAHLTDPHLPLTPARPGQLVGKRLLGWLSWQRRRRSIHRPEVLAALVGDVCDHAPDVVAVTGDLCNIALPAEIEQARAWLGRLGPPDSVAVVPGNHDAYAPAEPGQGVERWGAYMAGDGGAAGFPWLRVRGDVAIVGVSSAVPMPWYSAGGRVGAAQTEAARRLLAEQGRAGRFRVLLIHHPPVPGGARRKRLADMAPFAAAVAGSGVELVLHGHTHVSALGRLQTAAGSAPVVGVASASARPVGHAEKARWNLYRIERRDDGWHVAVTVRGLAGAGFATDARFDLPVRRAA